MLHSIQLENTQVLSINYEAEGKFFAVGCEDMYVRIYDEATKALVTELQPGRGDILGHGNRVFKVK